MLHVDDYLDRDSPAVDPIAKEYLLHARRPAIDQDRAWLKANAPWVTWRGKRYQCVGASTLGDVWLRDTINRPKDSTAHYDHRVDIAELSGWTHPEDEPRFINAEDLRITILRTARPGDVVMLHIAQTLDIAHRPEIQQFAERLGKFLATKGMVPVILPDFIQASIEEPRAADQLSPIELAALIGWHEKVAGLALRSDELERANWHRGRAHELKKIQATLKPRCICPSGISRMDCPACGSITQENQLL